MSLKPVLVSNAELLVGVDGSKLNDDISSGSSTITVYSISKFTVNIIVLIGELGSEGSEIIKTSITTAPSGNTVTLASNTVKAHSKGAPVYILPFDQLEIYHAATDGGSKSLLVTQDIDAERIENLYEDTAHTSGGYYTRYKDSINSTYSDYSDYMPFAGLDYNTAGYVMSIAMRELNKEYSALLTEDLLLEEINACLRYIRGELKRWSNFQQFDYIVGQTSRGVYDWAMPTDAYDINSYKAVLSVRVGNDLPLNYADKKEMDSVMEDTNHTEVKTQPSIGDTSIVLDNTYDFDSSGSIHIYSSNTLNTITYTSNDRSTGTLSGIASSGTGSITVAHAVDTDVWQNESEAKPEYFTIFDGRLYIFPLCSSSYHNMNIMMDYYTDISTVDSFADTLVGPRADMIKHWLKWKIRAITENNGKEDMKDPDFSMFLNILKKAIRLEVSGQKYKMKPKLNQIQYRGRRGTFDTN